jgi:outer membrane protein
MLRKKMYSGLLLWLLLAAATAPAQERFSLEALVQRTLEENYQLQIVLNQQQMADNMNTAGNAGMLPSVALTGDRSWEIQTTETNLFTGEVRSGDNALSTAFNAMVAVDWLVFDGFSMFARRDRLGHLASLGRLDTRYFVEQTVADLARIYYRLIMEQRLLASYRQSLEVSAFRLELEDRRRQLGAGSALLYQQALMDFNADSALVVDQQMLVRDYQVQLSRIINRDPRLPLEPQQDTIALRGVEPLDRLLELALANNRELERSRLEEMLAEAGTRVERGARYPEVSVFGSYGYSRQTSELGIIESSQSRGARFGLRVRFNLYDGGRQNTRVDNALLEQQSAGLNIQDTRAWLEADLLRLLNRHEALTTQLQLMQESVAAANRSLTIAREQLQTGAINGYEFRQTQLTALHVENQLTQLLYAIKAIEIDLQRISGTLMERLMG